jgi:hypothetical protein
MHDEAYWQRARALIERKRKPPLAPRKRKRTWEEMEDRRFFDRLRFDQSAIWNWNRPREPRSLIPSTWPRLEAEMRKYYVPGFWPQFTKPTEDPGQ